MVASSHSAAVFVTHREQKSHKVRNPTVDKVNQAVAANGKLISRDQAVISDLLILNVEIQNKIKVDIFENEVKVSFVRIIYDISH